MSPLARFGSIPAVFRGPAPFPRSALPLLSALALMASCLTSVMADPATGPDYSDLITGTDPVSQRKVLLDVPLVRQPRAKLCGPAAIEMVFRYWGEKRFDQYDIARAMAVMFHSESGRFKDSAIVQELREHSQNGFVDWKKYPGTGTYNMREFLKQFAPTVNPRIKRLPEEEADAAKVRDRFFLEMKGHLDSGSPVIVHQWYDERFRSQHYRVVTGYDDLRRILFLNDPAEGRIEMSYEQFLKLWNVDENWLSYNNIVFNRYAPARVKKGELRVKLKLTFDE
ncbi:MAG: hypothetical protein CMN76_04345 [Spirochaetaceae bacterium]|nr:hypothetical protein [Spirochaetaceae bacterium]